VDKKIEQRKKQPKRTSLRSDNERPNGRLLIPPSVPHGETARREAGEQDASLTYSLLKSMGRSVSVNDKPYGRPTAVIDRYST
jgi:hypothetical protein